MKSEFEKWWITKGIEWNSIEDEGIAKTARIAALKWAQNQANYQVRIENLRLVFEKELEILNDSSRNDK